MVGAATVIVMPDERPRRHLAQRRDRAVVVSSVTFVLLVAGCSSGGGTITPSATVSTVTAGTITSQVTNTVTSTAGGGTVRASPPAPTPEPAPVDADCPYLANDAVADINGQHTGTTQIIDVAPYPICIFTRSDGEPLASIRVIQADTPESAVAAVDAHVPIDGSDPASQPPGWSGGSMVTDTGSIYAVSKGTIAVVAESNQQQSIKGRQMVITAVGNLGL